MAEKARKTPPGTFGLPLIGETLKFLANPYRFVTARRASLGSVFKTNILGRRTGGVVGPKGCAFFAENPALVREGSQPSNVFALFAGPSLPHLDGQAHRERKAIIMQAFTRDALTAYAPSMSAGVDRALEQWADGVAKPWMPRLKRLSLEAVARDILSLGAGPRLDEVVGLYDLIAQAFTSLPLPVPGASYTRGLAAVERVLALFLEMVKAHRAAPSADGLSRILGHTTPAGTRITDDQACRELHHLIIAGRVVYAHLATAVLELGRHPEIRARVAEELARVPDSGVVTLEQIDQLDYLRRVVLEVKRVSPVVPGIFGKLTRDAELDGHSLPSGWAVLLGLYAGHFEPAIYPDPERFDPDRYLPERAEHRRVPHAFAPHGPGEAATSHHCAGTEYATYLTSIFILRLVRGYTFELPAQDLTYDFTQLTPDPADGLRVILKRNA